jgi:hypothetical protein
MAVRISDVPTHRDKGDCHQRCPDTDPEVSDTPAQRIRLYGVRDGLGTREEQDVWVIRKRRQKQERRNGDYPRPKVRDRDARGVLAS